MTWLQRYSKRPTWYGHVLWKDENDSAKNMHGFWTGGCKT